MRHGTVSLHRPPKAKEPRRESTGGAPLDDYKTLLLDLLPDQGGWTEEEYLWLTDHTNRLVEFNDGAIEVLPMPTDLHQSVLKFLFLCFHGFVEPRGGVVHFAPLRLRIRKGVFRQPDLLLLTSAEDPRRNDRFWTGADLALEVVSPDKPQRDLVQKRHEYALAKVPEYWIANPLDQTILVLALKNKKYQVHGRFRPGKHATSLLLPGFAVEVAKAFQPR